MKKKQDVALVLSSGGARGITHIGVIEELVARGYNITSVSGASIGAVIGGFYAAGKLEDYKNWICGLDRVNVFNLIDFSISTKGVIKGQRVFKKLSEWMNGVTFDDLSIPFSCVAVDLFNRREVVFSEGDVLEAMRASIAIPGYLEPQIIDGSPLYDGGIINPIPINRVKRNGNDIVVAIDLNAYMPDFDPETYWEEEEGDLEESTVMKRMAEMWNSTTKRMDELQKRVSNETVPQKKKDDVELPKDKKMNRIGALTEMFELMQESLTKTTVEHEKPDVFVEIPRNLCNTFEFHRSADLVEFGRQQMKIALDKLEATDQQAEEKN